MNKELETLHEIKSMMEKSSRFISLSGLSGISAGICALIGATIAIPYINFGSEETIRTQYRNVNTASEYLIHPLTWIGLGTFIAAFICAFLFTFIKSKKQGISIWGGMAQKVFFHFSVPFVSGSLLILYLIFDHQYSLVAPLSLIVYGFSLFSAYKYTVKETMYLSLCMISLGLINLLFSGYSVYFWVLGFGIAHIVYGSIMWYKYDRLNK